MSTRFDPYHSWLGIPAEEQPPNHYRLLGISLFESNEDVIQNGLDQRMAHVKSFATGPRAAESQKLLTELSQAGVCLLRPEKKQVYDEELRLKLQNSERAIASPAPPAPSPIPPQIATVPLDPPLALRQTSSSAKAAVGSGLAGSAQDGRPSRGGFPIVPTIVGGVIGLSAALLVLFMLSPGRRPSDVAAQTRPVQQIPEGTAEGAAKLSALQSPQSPVAPPDGGGEEDVPNVSSQPAPAGQEMPAPQEPAPAMPQPEPPGSPFETGSSQPPPGWPTPLPGSPTPAPVLPQSPPENPFLRGSDPSTFQGFPPASAASEPSPPVTLTGASKSILLDFEGSSMHATLADSTEGQPVRAQVRSLTNFTAYSLQPVDGILSVGQPVDVLLTDYAGVKLRLSLRMRGKSADLEIAPEMQIGQGKTSDFSRRTLERMTNSTKKDAVDLNEQLKDIQVRAVAIQNWLAIPRPAPVRAAQIQQLNNLMVRVPLLQKQLADCQKRLELIQQLSLFVGQMHGKAGLDLVVEVGSANTGP